MLFLFIFIHLYDRAEHSGEDPQTPLESELFTLPKFIPIDWFDPGYWNTVLIVRERLDYIEHDICIGLPLVEHCQDLGAVQFVEEPTRGRVYGNIW